MAVLLVVCWAGLVVCCAVLVVCVLGWAGLGDALFRVQSLSS